MPHGDRSIMLPHRPEPGRDRNRWNPGANSSGHRTRLPPERSSQRVWAPSSPSKNCATPRRALAADLSVAQDLLYPPMRRVPCALILATIAPPVHHPSSRRAASFDGPLAGPVFPGGDVVLLQLPPQSGAADAQSIRGLQDVAARFPQCGPERIHFRQPQR